MAQNLAGFVILRFIREFRILVGAKDIEVFGQHGSDSIQPADPLTSL
jgi:hypothetical protein